MSGFTLRGPGGWILFGLILVLSVGLRTRSLDRDPPRKIAGGPTPNEGLYVLNARNMVMDGRWKRDEWNSAVLQPLGSSATAAMFRASGVGVRQARLVSVILSSLALVLFFFLVRDGSGVGTALLASLFLGTNAVFLVYSRQAGPAPLGILLMLVTVLLWRGATRYELMAPLAGAVLAVAAIVENGSHNMFFLATGFLATLMVRLQSWKMPWAPRVRTRVRRFWWGCFLMGLGWVVLFVIPNRGEFLRMLNTPLSRLAWGNLAHNIFQAPFNFGPLVQWTPVISLVCLVYFLIFARTLMAPIARHRPLSETRVWFFCWLVTGPLFMALRSERPLNVLVLIVPPLCMAAAEALTLFLSIREIKKPRLDILVVLGLLTVVTWITVHTLVHAGVTLGYRYIPAGFFQHQFRWEFAVVFLVAAPLVVLIAHLWLKWKKFTLELSPGFVSVFFVIMLGGILLTNVWGATLIFRSEHDVDTASRSLSSLPRGSVVAGTWAPLLSLDSGNRSVVLWPSINGESDAIDRNGVTHLLLQEGSPEMSELLPASGGGPGANVMRRDRSIVFGRFPLELYHVIRGPKTESAPR